MATRARALLRHLLAVIVLLMAGLPVAWPTASHAQATGLLAAYAFDEASGSGVSDASGNGNTGTLVNGPVWASGRYGSGISFDGADDYVGLPSILDVSTLPFTISAWVNPVNYNDYRKIFSKRDAYDATAMRFDVTLYIGDGRVVLEQQASPLAFSYAPPTNTWTHLAIVARADETDLYVNGSLQQTLGSFTLGTAAAAQVRIGRAGDGQDPFLGAIDEVRIYNRALSQAEIQNDMNTPVGDTQP